jgi:ankyrin repeat protein
VNGAGPRAHYVPILNHSPQTSHHSASSRTQGGFTALAALLVNEGDADVNKASKEGRTPLYFAASENHTALVRLLIESGRVEVDLADNRGRTPLYKTALAGHEGILTMLLKEGRADANKANKDGWTPLLLAAQKGELGRESGEGILTHLSVSTAAFLPHIFDFCCYAVY